MRVKYMSTYIIVLASLASNAFADVDNTYEIQAGDTFWTIAERYYGDPNRWTDIARANQHVDPRQLGIGQVISLPEATGGSGPSGRQDIMPPATAATVDLTPQSPPIDYWLDPTVTDTVHFDGSKWTYVPVPVFVELSKKRMSLVPFKGEQIDSAIFQDLMPKDPRVNQ